MGPNDKGTSSDTHSACALQASQLIPTSSALSTIYFTISCRTAVEPNPPSLHWRGRYPLREASHGHGQRNGKLDLAQDTELRLPLFALQSKGLTVRLPTGDAVHPFRYYDALPMNDTMFPGYYAARGDVTRLLTWSKGPLSAQKQLPPPPSGFTYWHNGQEAIIAAPHQPPTVHLGAGKRPITWVQLLWPGIEQQELEYQQWRTILRVRDW